MAGALIIAPHRAMRRCISQSSCCGHGYSDTKAADVPVYGMPPPMLSATITGDDRRMWDETAKQQSSEAARQ